MKKFIITLSIILFITSYIIVCVFGQEKTMSYNTLYAQDVKVECNEKIVKCKTINENRYTKVILKSVKPGETIVNISYKTTLKDGEVVEVGDSTKVFVHITGVITTNHFLGKCTGDISFIISFYLIVLLIIIEITKNYIKRRNKNLYSYKNVKTLGLIIYLVSQYLFSLFLFIYDALNGYTSTIQNLISILKDDMSMLVVLTFPLAGIVVLLVTISNIKLMKKEGKALRNMLGIILGGTLLIMFIGNTAFYIYTNNTNIIFDFLSYLIYTYIAYLECILLATCILGFKSARRIPKFDKDYIIILGCKIKEDGSLPPLLKNRVDRAIEFSKMQKEATGKDIVFVPSGGKGKDEVISEAEAMKKYLLSQGINKKNILIEDQSKNTKENIKFSNELIKEKNKDANIAFSTTNYHVFRAGILATKQKLSVEGIGSKTKAYYWINAFIREFVATLVSEKKSHIRVLIILFFLLLFNFIFVYLIFHFL